ncbi:hypothetical protein L211DRAFT_264024 [Terfezia boudieri ATCC MYA-4762]|uniref:Uncharacterized protein n=1 Tax=Terfezia boudieri ATCC MYA-4762 TaxID=1051890 RepID=A0A3N4M2J8_9PEZI|nr:hypothetical protein L211DRAFT_264024 [Terfezia boudieri ATCC MYA-4762]
MLLASFNSLQNYPLTLYEASPSCSSLSQAALLCVGAMSERVGTGKAQEICGWSYRYRSGTLGLGDWWILWVDFNIKFKPTLPDTNSFSVYHQLFPNTYTYPSFQQCSYSHRGSCSATLRRRQTFLYQPAHDSSTKQFLPTPRSAAVGSATPHSWTGSESHIKSAWLHLLLVLISPLPHR